MASDYTEFQIQAAEVVLEEHHKIGVPEAVCHRCLKPWPCADVTWAHQVYIAQELAGVR